MPVCMSTRVRFAAGMLRDILRVLQYYRTLGEGDEGAVWPTRASISSNRTSSMS